MMKRLTFTRLPAHGAGGIPTEGTVVDLLLAIPYLLQSRIVAPPAWVRTLDEWHAWTQEYRHGIPADRNLEYTRRLSALDAEREVAESRGDGEALARTLSELTELAAEYSDWIARHRRSQ